ncbi:GTP pyrophosphokinase [Nocardioides alcanivorans]|uniref:GTP pyrophosphokinase n=1 Tax=Nocardioides alcanivorans TaxID=2897352 RepID=UPI0024B21D8A|nr:(p)ppGpp synthetase [Nocardioides alcanivorans]
MQRTPPLTEAVQKYAARQDELRAATDRWVAHVQGLLDEAGINYLTVSGRTKSVSSFAGKAVRQEDGKLLYDDPLTQITDQIGVRVITYVLSDVAAVADLLADTLTVLDDRDLGQETASEGRFGYSSRHLLVTPDPATATMATLEELGGQPASVQLRTVLQHAWAEFEHDIRYKGKIPEEFGPDLDRRFTLAAGLLDLADREFSMIRERLRAGVREPAGAAGERIDDRELATFLEARYTEAGWSRTDHYDWMAGLLQELGITSLDQLRGLITTIDDAAIAARMGYKYPPGAVRRLDDALLAVHGTRYADLSGNAHRRDALLARLEKLVGDDPDAT